MAHGFDYVADFFPRETIKFAAFPRGRTAGKYLAINKSRSNCNWQHTDAYSSVIGTLRQTTVKGHVLSVMGTWAAVAVDG